MNLTDALQSVLSASGTLNRYRLDIPSCSSPLDVEEFSGTESMSRMYSYDIIFTSTNKYLDASQLLRKPATLTMGGGLLETLTEQKKVHGVITDFRRLSGSADQTLYRITLKPFLSLLDKQHRSHRFFVNKSVPEVVEQVLQEHGLHDWEYEFNLKQSYPKREQINQYQESDLIFIQRLLAEVGIFYFFTLQEDAQTEVVHFADAQRALIFGKRLPVNSPSGMSDSGAESVWGLNVAHNVVEANVTAKDYNHRDAQSVLQSAPADMTLGDGEGMTYGEVYHYRLRHLERGDKFEPQAETANFYARLDHERFLAEQVRIIGKSTDVMLAPAQVLTITDSLPPTLPEILQEPLLLTAVGFTASRKDALQVTLLAVPYSETLCWRPPLLPRPKVTGTMTARVTSAKANDIYAWQDASGLYRVKFDADRDDKSQGQESMPVRLAKPYGGDVYGFHFPLIQGTEVAIAFHEGDPDRPYIAHALHDSRHVDHVTEKNSTRNVIRTPTNNKLRMEDKRGEEHIKLSTEYGGKTQLNLGHNVDAGQKLRGEGFELRTDSWGVIRGGKGVFISGDVQPNAQGETLDMAAAVAQLQSALELVTALAQSVAVSGALNADRSSQHQLNQALNQLKEAGILASAPAGIALTTPKNIQLSSGHTLTATAGENIDMSIFKRLTVAAGEAISLFAQKMGVKLFAARGIVDIQAQTDAIRIQSDKSMNLNSINDEIVLNAAQGITLTSTGGAYIKIKNGSVEIGAPGKIDLKSASILWGGASSLEKTLQPMVVEDPQFKYPMNERFQILDKNTNQPKAFISYRIETSEGTTLSGMTDENGYTQCHYGFDSKSIKLFFE
ncbi:type VI secretion system tip protein VgrG [Leclercia adecarboxylata]|uniref:Type VI secretion system tip protein VgrG n=1 Tax=Leclercia adecarboxylata TaxID=83655 RepID=A0A9X4BCE4_9ENTR|nr:MULTISPECIES: type VI secretion system Vgr family protein [Enterobacteriaceae]MBD1403865.1 type VI secretion system tip protein VgrG [Leclercia adecarboxylata]MDC6620513.1 type VI secretion system tip protein VgrG [Leclercia adecarboxylata]MDC6632066.1 type VI secretion system tip protein VgrG [Leclercia adecarboxylata]MDC6636955.1 type VI secretion system tip protein VgrG [Leclercia adecarboxylata]MDC6647826.1 type VI secretion system tip protein VgrG [Leclercia adecarboxylata]